MANVLMLTRVSIIIQNMAAAPKNSNSRRGWSSRAWWHRKARKWGITNMTLQAAATLVLAMATAWLWNSSHEFTDPNVRAFVHHFCRHSFCHVGLAPTQRTVHTTRPIAAGTELLHIPRSVQIWDLDALRDKRIQALFAASQYGAMMDAGAYLAVYLLYLQNTTADNKYDHTNGLMRDYLQLLPSEYHYHPLIMNETELTNLLGNFSYAFQLTRALQQQSQQEYNAMVHAAHDRFPYSLSQYVHARLHVWTRSFGTGSVVLYDNYHGMKWSQELEHYRHAAGVDLTGGSHAMVPILDLYNHHSMPNVKFEYRDQAFVISSNTNLPPYAELRDTYGRHSQSHLWAKYGFANEDDSDYTQASLALWHVPMATPRGRRQRLQLALRYLAYDDGYATCVTPHMKTAWQLKLWQLEYVVNILDRPLHWVATLPPRNPHARPALVLEKEWTNTERRKNLVRWDSRALAATCRLLTLTERDYGGDGANLLQTNLRNTSFELPNDEANVELQIRTLFCLARLASTQRSRYEEHFQQRKSASRAAGHPGQRTALYVLQGEAMALDDIKESAFATLRQKYAAYLNDDDDPNAAIRVRREPCEPHLLQQLYEDATHHDATRLTVQSN